MEVKKIITIKMAHHGVACFTATSTANEGWIKYPKKKYMMIKARVLNDTIMNIMLLIELLVVSKYKFDAFLMLPANNEIFSVQPFLFFCWTVSDFWPIRRR